MSVSLQALILVSAVLETPSFKVCQKMKLQHGFFGSGGSILPSRERHLGLCSGGEKRVLIADRDFWVMNEAGT
jgi:hypothetical protein